jgi:hypothetical protein
LTIGFGCALLAMVSSILFFPQEPDSFQIKIFCFDYSVIGFEKIFQRATHREVFLVVTNFSGQQPNKKERKK